MPNVVDTSSLPTLACPRLAGPLQIDGDINKAPWSAIAPQWLVPATGARAGELDCLRSLDASRLFGEEEPPAGLPLSFQPTTVRACWDAEHLYVAFQALDRDIWANCTRRNEPLYDEEVVEIFLTPNGDLHHYYELEVSPRNVIFEAEIHSPDLHRSTMQTNLDWQCRGMKTAVQVRGTLENRQDVDRWWSVELAIPFVAFPDVPAPRAGDRWPINFFRIDRPETPEYSAWSPTLVDPADFHLPARFGQLVFAG